MFAAEADANTRQKIRTVPYGKLIHKYDISVSLRVSIFFFFSFFSGHLLNGHKSYSYYALFHIVFH